MLFLDQPALLHQRQRQGDETGHEYRMQGQDGEVQTQQVDVLEGRPQRLRRHAGLAVLQRPGILRHYTGDDQDAEQRHRPGGPEQPGQAEGSCQQRADHHGHGERQADAHADHGHGLGAVLLAGQIRQQRHHRRRNRASALQHAPGDHTPDRIGIGRQHAAGGENQQTGIDHRAAADTVADDAKGNLQHGLGQAIGTDSQTNQRRGTASQIHAIGGQHRQHHEHAQHTKREHHGQATGRAGLATAHALTVRIVHRIHPEEIGRRF